MVYHIQYSKKQNRNNYHYCAKINKRREIKYIADYDHLAASSTGYGQRRYWEQVLKTIRRMN